LYEDYKIYKYHQISPVRTVLLKKLNALMQYVNK
jgi:hypothetical protein